MFENKFQILLIKKRCRCLPRGGGGGGGWGGGGGGGVGGCGCDHCAFMDPTPDPLRQMIRIQPDKDPQ
jgi:hypothetical protein